MTAVFTSEQFLNHDTGTHPEKSERLASIWSRLDASSLETMSSDFTAADRASLLAVHTEEYVTRIDEFARNGGGFWDGDTIVCPQSFEVAQLAAGAAIAAVDTVLVGEHQNALCLARPPGHHAVANNAMGFCLLNNVAIVARHAIDTHDLNRVLIVDWDVHHGNGTQDLFFESDRVHFFSAHRHPFYPGTGMKDETGTGPGLGCTLNLPLPFGISRDEYFEVFHTELAHFAEKCQPELILISAGFDAHVRDPIGSLGLESEDFGRLTKLVMQIADTQCHGKIVSLLEGGYNVDALAESVEIHLRGLNEAG